LTEAAIIAVAHRPRATADVSGDPIPGLSLTYGADKTLGFINVCINILVLKWGPCPLQGFLSSSLISLRALD